MLRDGFKFSTFERKRGRVVRSILSKEGAITVLPANANGSLYCRLPKCVVRNRIVVVSPLLSLVRSRTRRLVVGKRGGIVTFGSFLAHKRGGRTLVRLGRCGFVFVSPRVLCCRSMLSRLGGLHVTLFIISRTRYVSR